MADRPPPPSDVALQLRQEAGFGCCWCGHPIFVYHHIVPWQQEHHYRPGDMMILCPNHHSTIKAVPESEQYKLKRNPHNIRRGYPRGHLINYSSVFAVMVADSFFVNSHQIIRFAREDLLSLSQEPNGAVSVNARLYDEKDNLLAVLARNQWIAHRDLVWDIVFKEQLLEIRQAFRKISLVIDLRRGVAAIRGMLWRGGYCIEATPKKLTVKNYRTGDNFETFSECVIEGFNPVFDFVATSDEHSEDPVYGPGAAFTHRLSDL